jgi:anti-sigma B factor antagonist
MATNGGARLAAAETGADRRGSACAENAVTNSDFAAGRGSTSPDNLAIRAYREDDRRTLVVSGELDLGSAPTFEDTIVRTCADGASELVLELSQLDFIDATGLEAVLSAKTVCARRGCAFSLTPRQGSDKRAFQLVRLSDYLPFRRSSRMKPAEPSRDSSVSGAQLISAWD